VKTRPMFKFPIVSETLYKRFTDCKENERVIEKNWEWDWWSDGVLSDEGPAIQMLTHTHTHTNTGEPRARMCWPAEVWWWSNFWSLWLLLMFDILHLLHLPHACQLHTHTHTHTHCSTCMLTPESNPSSTGWQPITQHPLPVCVCVCVCLLEMNGRPDSAIRSTNSRSSPAPPCFHSNREAIKNHGTVGRILAILSHCCLRFQLKPLSAAKVCGARSLSAQCVVSFVEHFSS